MCDFVSRNGTLLRLRHVRLYGKHRDKALSAHVSQTVEQLWDQDITVPAANARPDFWQAAIPEQWSWPPTPSK
jgi:hypothetical protein